jgi:surface polysaccharide O-acyltransferase-like enzyme
MVNPVTRQEIVRTTRIQYIDILRVLSMLSVVFLHTAAGSLRGNISSLTWHTANTLTSLMGISVPVFFMISGALLLSSEKTLSLEFTFKKRLPKVILPLITWSVTAVFYYALLNYIIHGSINWGMVTDKFQNITGRPVTVHLWFMYALIPLYLLSPVLKKLMDSMTGNLITFMLIIWVVFRKNRWESSLIY